MLAMMREYKLREMYLPKMPGLAKAFYVHLSLTKKYLPKLHTHMLVQKFEPSMYASQWFMTIFSVNMPFECIVRIWDIFFVEGPKMMYRVALAIFKINQEKLLKADLDGLFTKLREYSKGAEPELLIKTAVSFTFSKDLIAKLEKEFEESPDPELNKYCIMWG